MEKKKIVYTVIMCALEARDGPLRSTLKVTIQPMIGSVIKEGVVAGHMQKAAMQVVVLLLLITAVFDALLRNVDFMAAIATFLPSYVDKTVIESKKRKNYLALVERSVSYHFRPSL